MGSEITQCDPHQDWVGLLQGPQENGGGPVLPLPWLRTYGGGRAALVAAPKRKPSKCHA